MACSTRTSHRSRQRARTAALACREEGFAERTGRKMDEAIEDLRDGGEGAAEKAGREVDEALDDAAEEIDELRDEAAEAIESD